jgi:hypothetical protein
MKLASSASAPMVSMVINNKKKMEKHCRPLRHASTRADLGLFEANFTIEQKDELAKRVKHRVDKITYALHAKAQDRRQKLDEGGMFHSDANEVRVQNALLVELQRSLNMEDIHDAVLQDMKGESEGQQAPDDDLDFMSLYKGRGSRGSVTAATSKGTPKMKGAAESPRRQSNIRGAKHDKHGRRDVVSFLKDKLGDSHIAASKKAALAQVVS